MAGVAGVPVPPLPNAIRTYWTGLVDWTSVEGLPSGSLQGLMMCVMVKKALEVLDTGWMGLEYHYKEQAAVLGSL